MLPRSDVKLRNEIITNRITSFEYPKNKRFKDLSGLTHGRLHIDRYYGLEVTNKNINYYYECTCECGNKVYVNSKQLQSKKIGTKSCGCLREEKSFHTHRLSKTRLYHEWKAIRLRCNNPNNPAYNHYGGRGIKVCEEWNDPIVFIEWALANGYDDSLSIDRIDVDGDYCPENCRWVDNKMQGSNRTSTHFVQIDRWVLPILMWSKIVNISDVTIHKRIRNGWSEQDAILVPRFKLPPERIPILDIPFEYEKYNKYDEWVKKGKIKPVEETIYKDCPYIEHK